MENKILKIELGGGENPIKNGFLNVDARPLPTVDIIADIRDLPFENESVDEIFTTNVLEHFNFSDVKKILNESFRVLKIGGKIEIIVPDLETIIEKYKNGEIDFEKFNMWIYGAQSYSYDFHRSCLDYKNFKKILSEIGFTKIEKVPYSLGRNYIDCPMLQIVAYKEKKYDGLKNNIKKPLFNREISFYEKISGKEGELEERVVPHIEDRLNYLFHLTRYYFSLLYLRDKDVVDIGCGTGYGDFIISKEAKRVIGIDNSKEAIDFAKEHYKKENVEFYQMDWKEIKNFKEKFDVIISFEFIEHIKEQEEFLGLIKEILKENGIVIISTPNKSISSGNNIYHCKELNPLEFENLTSKYFKNYRIYGQFLRDKCKEEIKRIEEEIKRHSKYIEIIRKFLSPLRYLRRRFILKERIESKKEEKNIGEIFIGQYLISQEDILFTTSPYDIWRSNYLIAVIKNGK